MPDDGRGRAPVSEFFGIAIAMYQTDRAPPHFHASYERHERSSSRSITLEFVDGWLPKRAYALVLEWAAQHGRSFAPTGTALAVEFRCCCSKDSSALLARPQAGALAVAWIIGAYAIVFGLLLVGLGVRVHRWVKFADRLIPTGGTRPTHETSAPSSQEPARSVAGVAGLIWRPPPDASPRSIASRFHTGVGSGTGRSSARRRSFRWRPRSERRGSRSPRSARSSWCSLRCSPSSFAMGIHTVASRIGYDARTQSWADRGAWATEARPRGGD